MMMSTLAPHYMSLSTHANADLLPLIYRHKSFQSLGVNCPAEARHRRMRSNTRTYGQTYYYLCEDIPLTPIVTKLLNAKTVR